MLHLKFTSRPFDKLKTRCAVVTAFSDLRPLHGNAALLDWRMNGRLSDMLAGHRFEGMFREALLLPAEGRIRPAEIMVLGLGERGQFNESHVALFTHSLLEKLSRKKIPDFMLSLSDLVTDRFEWRNSVRLLVSKLHDHPDIESVYLCEPEDCVKDAKRRHMDFGMNVEVSFETLSSY